MPNPTKVIYLLSFFIILCSMTGCKETNQSENYIMTVSGKINVNKLGRTLPHEHIIVDFIGAEIVKQPQYSDEIAIEIILPHLMELKKNGIGTIFECTPNYIGRNPQLLKKLSDLSGINIVTNTGYYAAVDKKYLPQHAYDETAEQISKRWENEAIEGIENTKIKPGFIKLGVGSGPLDSIETKLLEAAILLSKKTNLTIAIHTGDGEAAESEFNLLKNSGLKLEKMIWVHAQNGTDIQREKLAKEGVWISLDGVSETRIKEYINMVIYLKDKNLLNKILISHDDGWSVTKNDGDIELDLFENGNSKPYHTIINQFLDSLILRGFDQNEINLLLKDNPIKSISL